MNEISGRKLNKGDLVFYLTKKGLLDDVHYGLVVSDDRVFDGKSEILPGSVYLAALTEKEENRKTKLIDLYNVYQNNLLEKVIAKKRKISIGDIFRGDGCYESHYIMYLGSYYIGFNNEFKDTNKDKVHIYIKCYYHSEMEDRDCEDDIPAKELFGLINMGSMSDKEVLSSMFKYIGVYYHNSKYEHFKSSITELVIRKTLYVPTEPLYKKVDIIRDSKNINSLDIVVKTYENTLINTNFLYRAT